MGMDQLLSLDDLAQRADKNTALELYKAQFTPITSEQHEIEVLDEEGYGSNN